MSSSAYLETLPTELKLDILSRLALPDVCSLSLVNRSNNTLCVSSIFKTVELNSLPELRAFLNPVLRRHYVHIRSLAVCTRPRKSTEDCFMFEEEEGDAGTAELSELLAHCSNLQRLSLRLWGSPDVSLIPSFSHLEFLRVLSLSNVAPADYLPMSECFVVSVASTVPHLTSLHLTNITRSLHFAKELLGTYPFLAVANDLSTLYPTNGGSGVAHPLPHLLSLPYLRKLSIHDTHLGDPLWAHAPVRAPLTHLALGLDPQELPERSEAHAALFLSNPHLSFCPTLESITLDTPACLPPSSPSFGAAEADIEEEAETPLSTSTSTRAGTDARFAALTQLRISSLFPLDAPSTPADVDPAATPASRSPLGRTLEALGGAPHGLAHLAVGCAREEAVEGAWGALAGVLPRLPALGGVEVRVGVCVSA